jgi:hypothetical protein
MSDRLGLQAEQSFLQARLAALPPNARLTRLSAQARLAAVTDELARLPEEAQTRAKVLLTFRGKPVFGSQGIFSDFGMKAVNSFSDAVAAVAASLNAPLAAMGPIPNRDSNQLLITGTAIGSFGFELQELPPVQPDLNEPTAVRLALEQTQNLLQGSIATDDELLANTASELDQRAIDKVRAFVVTLLESDAICTLQNGTQTFSFTDLGQVRSSIERLSTENLQERTVALQGVFEGMLPKSRTFEFKRSDTGEIINGKIASSIQNPEVINRHLQQEVELRLTQTTVGRGRPRYGLAELPDWL